MGAAWREARLGLSRSNGGLLVLERVHCPREGPRGGLFSRGWEGAVRLPPEPSLGHLLRNRERSRSSVSAFTTDHTCREDAHVRACAHT